MPLKTSQVKEIKYYKRITVLYGEDIYQDCMHLIMTHQFQSICLVCVWGERNEGGKGDVNMWGQANVLTLGRGMAYGVYFFYNIALLF